MWKPKKNTFFFEHKLFGQEQGEACCQVGRSSCSFWLLFALKHIVCETGTDLSLHVAVHCELWVRSLKLKATTQLFYVRGVKKFF
jgi:hypothetical protein